MHGSKFLPVLSMKVAVILPTYNERENILSILDALRDATSRIAHYDFTFLVVDDNSPDGTQDLVRSYQKKHHDVVLLTGKKEGLGKALLRGLTYAVGKLRAEILVQIDADFSHDPASLPSFFDKLDHGADFVVGSRYIPGGSIPENWGIHRKIYSVIGNGVVRFGLGYTSVHDWTGGYRAYKKIFFERVRDELIPYSGYVFQIAFLHKSIRGGAKVAEVPIKFTDRRFGHSKIAPMEYIPKIFEYVIRARIRSIVEGSFGKFLVVGTVGFIINTVILEVMVRAGYSPTIGSVLGAEFAIISNFSLNNAWTFRNQKITGVKQIRKFFDFNVASLGAIVIQAGSVGVGTYIWGRGVYRLFYIIGVLIGLFWNYTMYSRVIWKKDKKTMTKDV